jgi:ribonuclease BN (tRNA processing enzyme)
MEQHLSTHHLLPKDVAELASKANVKSVVVTHFVGIEPGDPGHFRYLQEIAQTYGGAVVIAEDLDEF